MSSICPNPSGEVHIIWLEDPSKYRYLREGTYLVVGRHTGKIHPHIQDMAFIVGYATVRPQKGRQVYNRRFWWLKKHDQNIQPDGDE
jgi:hypothetical protein